MTSTADESWMALALRNARRAEGYTMPNPMVGAVVVRDGIPVGIGWHKKAGTPHAEPNALDAAGPLARGATLYVTLEPCCTKGRTPPCTERIIKSGIRRVVFACLDPNPRHAGAAIPILQAAGIQVDTGCLQKPCAALNRDFFWWITHRMPYVTLKMAMTLDGKIATQSGDSKWITGPAALAYVQHLRKRAGAIMVGGETVRMDNPSLLVHIKGFRRMPRRLVWSSRPIPPHTQLQQDDGPPPELVKPQTREQWQTFLHQLGQQEITNLLLEGGGELAASALKAGIINHLDFFIAPKILGGRESRNVVGGPSPLKLAEAIQIPKLTTRHIGQDLLLSAELL